MGVIRQLCVDSGGKYVVKKSRKVAFKHSSCLAGFVFMFNRITDSYGGECGLQALVLYCPSQLHHGLCFGTSDRWKLQHARHV